jgi:hypothetical protein
MLELELSVDWFHEEQVLYVIVGLIHDSFWVCQTTTAQPLCTRDRITILG